MGWESSHTTDTQHYRRNASKPTVSKHFTRIPRYLEIAWFSFFACLLFGMMSSEWGFFPLRVSNFFSTSYAVFTFWITNLIPFRLPVIVQRLLNTGAWKRCSAFTRKKQRKEKSLSLRFREFWQRLWQTCAFVNHYTTISLTQVCAVEVSRTFAEQTHRDTNVNDNVDIKPESF